MESRSCIGSRRPWSRRRKEQASSRRSSCRLEPPSLLHHDSRLTFRADGDTSPRKEEVVAVVTISFVDQVAEYSDNGPAIEGQCQFLPQPEMLFT